MLRSMAGVKFAPRETPTTACIVVFKGPYTLRLTPASDTREVAVKLPSIQGSEAPIAVPAIAPAAPMVTATEVLRKSLARLRSPDTAAAVVPVRVSSASSGSSSSLFFSPTGPAPLPPTAATPTR